MTCAPFLVDCRVDRIVNVKCMPDTGCNTQGLIDSSFVRRNKLERIPITPREVKAYDDRPGEKVQAVVKCEIDIGAHKSIIWAYEVARMKDQEIILGLPWLQKNDVVIEPEGPKLLFRETGLRISSIYAATVDLKEVSAAAYKMWSETRWRKKGVEIFAASLADIEKMLKPKVHSDPRLKLPAHYHKYLDVFDRKQADTLPPLRGEGIDHNIELVKDKDSKDPEVPYGPLYQMPRDELLVLRKMLTEYLDKGFIRVSNSPAAAPVLFARKPGGGLRFCVDYRALNQLTRKDRYPLPLINETLERIGKATWFTKLDVIAAFHRIRIAEGKEWMTAFRTRYGLFEWLVTPFGLANAPSTFQKYINWVLRDYLDEFVSAYIDDVLVFTTGSLRKHREHVSKVLGKLHQAGLQIDIDKCEFETQSTKYLGFIIKAGEGVSMDPEKVKAILEWEAPRSVKGVRSFLGFANFYRRFIRDFSKVAAPLTDLTKKDAKFEWSDGADQAFEKLKGMFVKAPVLMQFDPDRETILECDSSGYVVGGILSQYDDSGVLRPCAFFSQKNTPAECNYEIYDKELLAIVKCIREWSPELRSVAKFTVVTDHKNLTWFTTTRRLKERQMRWAEELSQYNFSIRYRPGKEGTQPDALSRREQDLPEKFDERFIGREVCLLQPEQFENWGQVSDIERVRGIRICLTASEHGSNGTLRDSIEQSTNQDTSPVIESDDLSQQWQKEYAEDRTLQELIKAVRENRSKFPSSLGIRVSISECSLNNAGELLFRGRKWVPDSEPLRTRILQEVHDSVLTGHPGREVMSGILARQFFWPQVSADVRRFVRNCDMCGANKVWRERKHGLLKPLPIPERIWREISIDFIEKLPLSDGCTNIMVITDRLSKGVVIDGLEDLEATTVAKVFIRCFYPYHGLPDAIVSDRGSVFIGHLWKRMCQLLKICRRLSTAHHPETDGSTERANAEIESYIRMFVSYAQENWRFLLPSAQLAINNRDATSTGVSPFFLQHGYNLEPIQLSEPPRELSTTRSPAQAGENIVKKLADARSWAQMSMAAAQQLQEEYANQHRQPAPSYRVGQKVWLDLRNIKTDRPSKKLDSRHAKFTVLKKIGSHAYRLNTPPGIHNVFHVHLLRPAADDPFPSQKQTDWQPPAILNDEGDEEWKVEQILDERQRRVGRGRRHEYLVKWTGYERPTWEPASAMEDTVALDNFQRSLAVQEEAISEEGGNVRG